MTEKQEIIQYCLTLKDSYEDYPFHDPNWCVIRHKKNRRVFASVIPAYHLNKKHWNSIILDGSVPDKDICRMVGESYDLTS